MHGQKNIKKLAGIKMHGATVKIITICSFPCRNSALAKQNFTKLVLTLLLKLMARSQAQ